jgi:predicted RNase H-like HicB family nuclease
MQYEARLTINVTQQGNRFVVYCPALDLTTSGKTETEAKHQFESLLPLFIEELEEAGTTGEVLSELGWKKSETDTQWNPPKMYSEALSVQIPATA